MSRPPKTTYKTTNWQNYNQALRQRGSLTVWFDPSMHWEAIPSGRRGRQQAYSDAAIQACLTLKTLLRLPLRQATGFVASLLELSGLGWSVPDFSTLSRRQKTLNVTIPYRGSKGPLHLLVDSTGIKVEGEGEWHTRKHGGSKRRVWRKIHLGIDEQTLEIRAVEVTSSNVGDAPMLPDLLAQLPLDQEIATVTADSAYDTRACHDAIADRGAAAIIPPRRNARPWKPDTAGARARNEILRTSKHLGRALWRNWSGYHRRSRVETKMNCVKLLGQKLMSRDFDRQVAEVQIRAAVMNRFTALGIPVTVALG
ncbi:IS5 family transposase [Pararhodobacter marinus]|uniref:IS5 family transposase n=1 Tax=Pararhodobacter marinus TaxID=2184063 RepID=UPI0035174B4F